MELERRNPFGIEHLENHHPILASLEGKMLVTRQLGAQRLVGQLLTTPTTVVSQSDAVWRPRAQPWRVPQS
jgi:hypothetical protein